jgi:hypothetical protein
MEEENDDNYKFHPAYDLFKGFCADTGHEDTLSEFGDFLDQLQVASMLFELIKKPK